MAAHTHPTPHRPRWNRRLTITTSQLAVLTLTLAAWQYLPHITWLRKQSAAFDPLFVSSPSKIGHLLYKITTNTGGRGSIWPDLKTTVIGMAAGIAIGGALGVILGLLFSHNRSVSAVFKPFVSVLNTIPLIAIVPVFIITFGPTQKTSIITSAAIVFFIIFWNAFSGGQSVAREMIQNAQLLGASNFEIMRQIRFPYVLAWTLAALPNAISLGLTAVVTAELLTGQVGMGRVLAVSVNTLDSSLTFSVVAILATVGVVLVSVAELLTKRILHWWQNDES
jgi:NitT/TauT family transport system permease protein